MKFTNPFTGKEMKQQSISEIFKLKTPYDKESTTPAPSQIDILKEEIDEIKAENEKYKQTFLQIAQPDVTSVEQIKEIVAQTIATEE